MNCAYILCGLCLAGSFGFSAPTGEGKPLDVPFFRQEKNGCGAASVAMVAHYWELQSRLRPTPVPSTHLIHERLYDAERRGILLADMRRYLAELGYQAFTLRGGWTDLEGHLSKGRPLIVGLRQSRTKDLHFVVVTGMQGDKVWLNDPTRKRPQGMKKADFDKQWAQGDRWILIATP